MFPDFTFHCAFVFHSAFSLILAPIFIVALGVTNVSANSDSADLIYQNQILFKGVESISPAGQKVDLNLLMHFLDKGYGGKGILPASQYDHLLGELRQLSYNAVNSISSEELCNQIGNVIETVSDYHLSIQLHDRYCGRLWPVGDVGKNSGKSLGNSTWALLSKTQDGKTIQVLSLKKFRSIESDEWTNFLDAVKKLKGANQTFIFDFRGNPGGDLTMGYRIARVLYGLAEDDKVPFPRKTIYRRRTPEAWALMANAFWIKTQKLKSDDKELPIYLGKFEEMKKYFQKSLEGLIQPMEVEELGPQPFDQAKAFQAPIYILVDRDCGSSCELTLEALESLPNVTTVGENTGGTLHFGNQGGIYLQNGHLIVNMPTQGTIYKDNRVVEKIGYSPKVRVPPGADALDFLLKTIRL